MNEKNLLDNEKHKNLILEYEQINANFRMLADVRFKLLALIPILGGAAVFVLSQIGLKAGTMATSSCQTLFVVALVSVFGFFATLGITIYDQRNSELYNALIHRAKFLETAFCSPRAPGGLKKVEIGGQFRERPAKNRKLLFKVGHDIGLSLIYGPLLGAWFLPFLYSVGRLFCIQNNFVMLTSASIALVLAIIFICRLQKLDTNDKKLYNDAARRDGMDQH